MTPRTGRRFGKRSGPPIWIPAKMRKIGAISCSRENDFDLVE
jgi:hypothetical protein